MKTIMRQFAIACLMATLLNGCSHSQIVHRKPAAVVEAAQSLAPWSDPPRYTTTEVDPNQEWSIVITENTEQKFEHHEITIQIKRLSADQSDVAISAFRISSFFPKHRKKANHVARKYAKRLAKKLKQE